MSDTYVFRQSMILLTLAAKQQLHAERSLIGLGSVDFLHSEVDVVLNKLNRQFNA